MASFVKANLFTVFLSLFSLMIRTLQYIPMYANLQIFELGLSHFSHKLKGSFLELIGQGGGESKWLL